MANVCFSILLVVAVLTIGGIVQHVPQAALAGILIVVGYEMVKPSRLARVRATHWSETLVMAFTFVLTLTIPMQYAILAGVALSLILYVYSSSINMRVVEIVRRPDGRYEERSAQEALESNQTTMLTAYGNAFFAAVQTLESRFPTTDEARNARVVLVLRGRDAVLSGFLAFLERLVRKLQRGGNRLMICGVEPEVMQELERAGLADLIGAENIFVTTSILGESLDRAYAAAQRSLGAGNSEGSVVGNSSSSTEGEPQSD
jgi:SulP family sulfate permease